MVVLESPLLKWIKKMARHDGLSISTKLRDIVREAYENYEDRYWSKEGEKRLKSMDKTKTLSHQEIWKKGG